MRAAAGLTVPIFAPSTPATVVTTPAQEGLTVPLQIGESSRRRFAVAVYGIVSIAVVVVAWQPDGDPADLPFLAAGYALAIWLAHSFANVVSGGANASWRVALRHESSVMAGAVPVIVVALLGVLFGWSATTVEVLALCSLMALLAAVQLVLLRTAPPEQRRLGATLVLDLISFVLIVLLLVAVH
jgi:hypothetical protein